MNEDPFAAARGIIYGCALSLPFWVAVVWWLL
jgi:hypothetical protein